MTSNKQLHANRANATKSTGPRSQAGKARSRLNSWKHGLTAKMLIIVGENADDFDQLRADLMDEYDPQSVLETELVERLAGILWRLRRAPFFEAAILQAYHYRTRDMDLSYAYREGQSIEEERRVAKSIRYGVALMSDRNDLLGKLARHEASTMSALTKTLQTLMVVQDHRGAKSGPVMLETVALPPAA
jgi:hypothetical protein